MKTIQKKPNIILTLLAIAALGIFLITACRQDVVEKEKYIINDISVFDTVTQIVGYDNSQAKLQEKADNILAVLKEYHQLYDIYQSYTDINNLRTINENAGIQPVKVDARIIELLEFSKDLYEKTDGKVNIAMGSVLKIWHRYRNVGISNPNNASLPPMEDLQAAALHTDINKIIIDKENSTVYLEDPEMSLDVGSVGKGYAVQKAAEYAREQGYHNIAISVGGNIAAVDGAKDDTDWRFAIQNPDLESDNPYLCKVDMADLCLVTSGDYQRYYEVDGKKYCHIINPDTLMPAEHFSAVSVIIPDSGMADALSTALFNMDYESGLALINSIENAEAIWVLKDGTVKYSENFEKFIVQQ